MDESTQEGGRYQLVTNRFWLAPAEKPQNHR